MVEMLNVAQGQPMGPREDRVTHTTKDQKYFVISSHCLHACRLKGNLAIPGFGDGLAGHSIEVEARPLGVGAGAISRSVCARDPARAALTRLPKAQKSVKERPGAPKST